MAVTLVMNGMTYPQASMADGLEWLRVLLADRRKRGCTVTPTEQAHFGVQYRIQHLGKGAEAIYLTDYPEPIDTERFQGNERRRCPGSRSRVDNTADVDA